MNRHPAYGLLYIILLPFALLLGLTALFYLLLAVQLPALLLAAFVTACFTIYTVATLIFYIKGVQQQKACKPALRDWIRVNAFVILLPAVLIFMEGLAVLISPGLMDKALQQLQQMQGQQPPFTAGTGRLLLGVFLVYTTALLVHLFYTFRLLKSYHSAFEHPTSGAA